MKLLDFKLDKLIIKHLDVFMSYERYMPEKAEQIKQDYLAQKEHIKMLNRYNLSPQPIAVLPMMPMPQDRHLDRKMRSTLNHDSSKALDNGEFPSIVMKAPNFSFQTDKSLNKNSSAKREHTWKIRYKEGSKEDLYELARHGSVLA